MSTPVVVVKHLKNYGFFLAGDRCQLAEVLNGHNEQDSGLPLPYSLSLAYIKPAERTLRHRLLVSEVYFVLEGKGILWVDEQPYALEAGSVCHVPGGCSQWVENKGDGCFRFLCIVSPAWEAAVEQILEP